MGNFNSKNTNKPSHKIYEPMVTDKLLCRCGRVAKYRCDFVIESTLSRNIKVPSNYPNLEPYFHSSRPNIGYRKSSLQINLYVSCSKCMVPQIKNLFDYSSKGWNLSSLSLHT